MRRMTKRRLIGVLGITLISFLPLTLSRLASQTVRASGTDYEFNDSHFHLTNYIQQGPSLQDFLKTMGHTVGRVALFGIPLQQEWSYRVSGDRAPAYYLDTDAPLYYYSFTDAYIAKQYLSLSPEEQARFDPMITGFNPIDMYGADHIRRVLETYPGVFCGIGEFTIHKEFVSAKVAGGVASVFDPALQRILDFAEEAGLIVLIHNDMDIPFAKPDSPPAYLESMKALLRAHPKTTIIWAHTGVGRVVRPVGNHAQIIEGILSDPEFSHVMFDISWDEVAKYLLYSPESMKRAADLINRYPDRIMFGTDSVAPKDQIQYLKTYHLYDSLWPLLTTEASYKVRKGNYVRIFDEGKRRVRAWEAKALTRSMQTR
jgi:predicted TIM-barrel fold metal-dependent hydrolase